MYCWQGSQLFSCPAVVVGSRAGQRSPVRLVPALRACACVCVWATSGPGWRFASPKSKVNPVSGVFFRQPYVIHEEELGFVGGKKKRQLPNWLLLNRTFHLRGSQKYRWAEMCLELLSQVLLREHRHWAGQVLVNMRPLLSAGPRTTSLRWGVGVRLLFSCLFHGQLLFLCTFKYGGGRKDNCSRRLLLLTPRFVAQAPGKAATCL